MPGSGMATPCAACRLLRRRCTAGDCVFAPYFPPNDPQRFAYVHKIYGASNVSKLLVSLPVHQRAEAVNSLVYQAEARVRDPVYGCVGAISELHRQLAQLRSDLAVANAEMMYMNLPRQPTPMDNGHDAGHGTIASYGHVYPQQVDTMGVDTMEIGGSYWQ